MGPGYRLSAFVRTQEIETASGPRLAVEDFPSGRILANTEEFLNTNDWLQHSTEFVTGPESHLVTLRVLRIPGNLLIKESLWMADVEMAPISAFVQLVHSASGCARPCVQQMAVNGS